MQVTYVGKLRTLLQRIKCMSKHLMAYGLLIQSYNIIISPPRRLQIPQAIMPNHMQGKVKT